MPKKTTRQAQRAQALKKRLREQAQHRKYVEGLIRQSKKERDVLLVRTMKRTSKMGIYNPKELKLTKYRRSRAKKALKEFGELLDPTKFFFIPAPKKIKKQVFKRAESLKIKHTRTGLIVPKEGHRKAVLKTDRKRHELYIERTGKTKRGPTRGVKYRTVTPLASIDELSNEKERIKNLAAALGPLGEKDRLAFIVVENGFEGYSKHTYSNLELLLNGLEQYKKTMAAKINFYRHIEIVRTTPGQWFAEHPNTNAGYKGRKDRDAIRERIRKKDTKTWNERQKRFSF